MTAVRFLSGVLLLTVVSAMAGPAPGRSSVPENGGRMAIGVTERLGQRVPDDIVCVNDRNEPVRLGTLLDRPAILSLVYYSCEHICPQVLTGLGKLASDIDLKPARDYRIITFSFDADDTPADAATARKNYTLPLGQGFPEDGWAFLTAGESEIARLTGALGFSFQKDEHGFTHPVILVILTPGGTISRYVRVSKFTYGVAYPVAFPAFETAELLRTAGRGAVSAGPNTPLLFCFPHEPVGQVGYFSLMTIFGGVTLLSLLALFIYLSAGRRGTREGR